MDEIGAYFKEKLNKADFKIRNLENQTRRIRNEFDKLTEREKSISVREDAPDYVFQVDCYEKNLDSNFSSTIVFLCYLRSGSGYEGW